MKKFISIFEQHYDDELGRITREYPTVEHRIKNGDRRDEIVQPMEKVTALTRGKYMYVHLSCNYIPLSGWGSIKELYGSGLSLVTCNDRMKPLIPHGLFKTRILNSGRWQESLYRNGKTMPFRILREWDNIATAAFVNRSALSGKPVSFSLIKSEAKRAFSRDNLTMTPIYALFEELTGLKDELSLIIDYTYYSPEFIHERINDRLIPTLKVPTTLKQDIDHLNELQERGMIWSGDVDMDRTLDLFCRGFDREFLPS